MLVNLMKGGPFGPAITTGGAAFGGGSRLRCARQLIGQSGAAVAALGSFLANGVPPSLRSAAQCTHVHCTHATHGTDTHHTQTDSVLSLKGVDEYVLWKKVTPQRSADGQSQTRLDRVPLSLISHVQVLAEVVARRVGGDVGKWCLIVWVEGAKSVFRLVLLTNDVDVTLPA
ncbi:hypothetical protein PR003_g26223 [Phytophthora rubi]|uniref:Peroxisomal membrane protein PEX16 n=1 Tax=Phytophthora rubi TaxID=129364 RepID=A0A6A3GY57_9STRA|nr:hypothetical protein PR001_g29817 [Phytophthora rubi]KAE9286801.1 hypothetical protein PR003_g26223 [Phytophthora rubi]